MCPRIVQIRTKMEVVNIVGQPQESGMAALTAFANTAPQRAAAILTEGWYALSSFVNDADWFWRAVAYIAIRLFEQAEHEGSDTDEGGIGMPRGREKKYKSDGFRTALK